MKNIIILEPNSAGVKLIKAAHKMGCKVYVFSYNAEDRKIDETHLQGCELVVIDTNDKYAVSKQVVELHNNVGINAIIPGFEYYVPLAAHMSALIGLRGLPVKTVNAMHYKHEMRTHLSKAGVRSPWFTVVNSTDGLHKAANNISFPCVLKPSHLAGSLYIKKLENMQELSDHFITLMKDQHTDLGHAMSGNVVIEEYLAGREFSVEGYVDGEMINFVSITDKYLGCEPHFVEVGHITRANTHEETVMKLMEYTESVIWALDINVGPFHCEMRMTEKGPVLIEIAARLVGDNISEIIELSTGVSLAEKMVQGYLGEVTSEFDFNNYKCHAGVRFLYGLEGDEFKGFSGIDTVESMPGFSRFAPLMKIGAIIPPFTDFRARVGEVVFTGATHAEVKGRLDEAEKILKIKRR